MSPRRKYTFYIDDEQVAGLRAIRVRDGILTSEQIRRAIDAWIVAKGVTIEKPAPRRVQPRRKASPRQ